MNRVLVGLVLGMVVGAAIALLYAPSSGEELRTELQERGKVALEEARAETAESEAEPAA